MRKNSIDEYRGKINSLIEKNKNLFISQPVILMRALNKKKGIFSLYSSSEQIYLRSNFSSHDSTPYIEFNETWQSNDRYEYSYRLTIPFFKFVYAFDGPTSKSYMKNFEFRYELHPEKTPKDITTHLHVLENVLPHYPTHAIDFEEFFGIIYREFINENSIDFQYA